MNALPWTFEPGVVACVLLAALWYGRGVHNLRRLATHHRAIAPTRIGAAIAGMLMVIVALMSPLDALATSLFSAHMVQHLVLVLLAAPLFVFAEPLQPALHALPHRWQARLHTWWT